MSPKQPYLLYSLPELRLLCFRITQQVRQVLCGERRVRLLDFKPYHVTPGWGIGLHTHSFYEAHLFLDGTAICTLPSGEYRLQSGSIMLHPPLTPHRWHSDTSPVRWLALWFQLETPEPQLLPKHQLLPELLSETSLLLQDVKGAGDGWRERTAMRMGLILSRLLSSGATETVFAEQADEHYELITMAEQFLRDNLAQPLTVADIAAHVGMSPSGIAHHFTRLTGQAVMERFTCLRMDRAAELLLAGTASLALIGTQIGTPDPSYFCRRFRRYFGMTPMAYRHAGGIVPAQ